MAHAPTEADVRVRVPAKINLALRVGPIGPDGYHPLATVFQAVSLYDEVAVGEAPAGRFSIATLSPSGEPVPGVPDDDRNLAVRAARLLAQTYRRRVGATITVRKSIPVAGGMAGGSADAAAALLGCAALWQLDAGPDDLAGVAAQLGSDVPFALLGGTAIGRGRGEDLLPLLARGSYHYVLALDDVGLSTPGVYRRFDELTAAAGADPPPPELSNELLSALAGSSARQVGPLLVNDLQRAAIDQHPRLADVLAAGRRLGAVGGIVSGSGPTCFFLAASESAAVDLSIELTRSGVCRAVRRVTGPVPGARVVG